MNDFLSTFDTAREAISVANALGIELPAELAASTLLGSGTGLTSIGAGSQAAMLAAQNAGLGAGAQAATIDALSSGVGGAGVSGALGSLAAAAGPAMAFIGGLKLLDPGNFAGGASDATKTGKYLAYFQRSPQEGIQNLNNIINNVKWSNESSNVGYVIKDALDRGIISPAYPILHSKDSILDLWKSTPASMAKYAYGLPEEAAKEYQQLVRRTERRPQMDDDFGTNEKKYREDLALRQKFEEKWLTNERKLATAKNLYDQIKQSGYAGDISKLEQFLANPSVPDPATNTAKRVSDYDAWRRSQGWSTPSLNQF